MKEFKFYWQDLTKECQQRLFEFLGGENGNYDVFPFAELEIEEDENEKDYDIIVKVEGYYQWSGRTSDDETAKKLAINAATEEDFGMLENISFDVASIMKE